MDSPFNESSLLANTPGHLNVPVGTPTPMRPRAQSFEPSSTRRSVHTPIQNVLRPPNSAHRGLSASGRRRNNTPTPHAKAAHKMIDQRRAAMTPRKKKSGQAIRRESSHDILSMLSRRLAPQSDIIRSSSPALPGSGKPLRSVEEEEEDDDELPIDRPNLTLPLYEDDEDDLVPPRSSMLDGDLTMEMSRRAYSERPPSRMSLGASRISDYYMNLDDTVGQGFLPPLGVDDVDIRDARDDTYERIEEDLRRESAPSRPSDFGFEVPLDADAEPSTFVMPLAPSSPERPPPLEDKAIESEAPPPVDDQWLEMLEQASEMDEDILGDEIEEANADNATAETTSATRREKSKMKSGWKISRHGHAYPPFPPATVKRIAEEFARTSGISNSRVGKETLAAFQQASDWFFEQVAGDLAAYAEHAGRKTINESDMELVMKRQRQITSGSTIFSLATQHLPQELVRELRMSPPNIPKKRRSGSGRAGDEMGTA